MTIGTLPFFRSLPILVKHLLRARLYPSAFICWILFIFSGLVERKRERSLGADMYVMF